MMGALVRYFLVLIGAFLPLFANAQPEKNWIETVDPREFVPECSLEDAIEMPFAEVAKNYQDLIGTCVKIRGYYSVALYDGVEGFVKSNGDFWHGVPDDILALNRMGVYFIYTKDDYLTADPVDEAQKQAQEAYWANRPDQNVYENRKITFAAAVYSCAVWLAKMKKKYPGMDIFLGDYCHYASGAILVVSEGLVLPGQKFDPVLVEAKDHLNEDWEFIYREDADEPDCTWETAEAVNLNELSLRPEKFMYTCVRVKGVNFQNRNFFDSLDNLYFNPRFSFPYYNPHRVGVYYLDQVLNVEKLKIWFDHKYAAEILGYVNHCDKLVDALRRGIKRTEEGERNFSPTDDDQTELIRIVFPGGYCHYWGGVFLETLDVKFNEGAPLRYTGEEKREQVGDLIMNPNFEEKDVIIRNAFRELAEQLLFLRGQPEKFKNSPLDRLAQFQKERDLRLDVPTVFFEKPEKNENHTEQGYACFCLEVDCKGKWPISSLDILYSEGQPYFCFSFFLEDLEDNPKTVILSGEWYY